MLDDGVGQIMIDRSGKAVIELFSEKRDITSLYRVEYVSHFLKSDGRVEERHHRIDGPAIVFSHGTKLWYHCGEPSLSQREHEKVLSEFRTRCG